MNNWDKLLQDYAALAGTCLVLATDPRKPLRQRIAAYELMRAAETGRKATELIRQIDE